MVTLSMEYGDTAATIAADLTIREAETRLRCCSALPVRVETDKLFTVSVSQHGLTQVDTHPGNGSCRRRHPAVVDKVVSFAQRADALAHVETGRAKGKVVITFNRQEHDHAS